MPDIPQHYGINNEKDAREIEWALRTFVERVRDGDEIPNHLLNFVADGVERFLKHGQPWSRKIDKSISNATLIGLMSAIEERGGKRTEIATHARKTAGRITQLLAQQDIGSEFHKSMYLEIHKDSSLRDMLYHLETLVNEFSKPKD